MKKKKKISTTTPSEGKSKRVEQQLLETTVKLTEAEINISLFSKMIRNGIATDVYLINDGSYKYIILCALYL